MIKTEIEAKADRARGERKAETETDRDGGGDRKEARKGRRKNRTDCL